jgi:ubiquinone/menaquinone biosynthesis C-methylase UbiE
MPIMVEYDEIAKHYQERRIASNRFDYNRDIEVPAMIKLIGKVNRKKILDLGCAFGDHAKILSKKGFKELVGMDLSVALIEFANHQKIRNAKFMVGDFSKALPFKSNYFDIVYSSLAIHYVKSIKKVFKEINRVLKKDGIFCLSTGHPIFNLINQSKDGLIGVKTEKDKKQILGNYFDESSKLNNLGSLGWIKLHNYTVETLIKSALTNGFELLDYVDAKPTLKSQFHHIKKFKLTNTLPTFILFKFRKK